MRVRLLLLGVAACGFQLDAGPRDGAAGDGADADRDGASMADATDVDALMVSACVVTPAAAATPISGIGGAGGSQQGALACGNGELPIGLQLDVTPQPIAIHGNQLLIVNVRVRCARVTRTTSNALTSAPQALVSHLGLTGSSATACDPYIPVNPAAEVTCPSGQVLVGIAGNQVDTTLYNSVSIRCATLTSEGAVTATSTVTMIGGTGAYTNSLEAATCPTGRAIISFAARSGCGQDSLTPACAPLTCL